MTRQQKYQQKMMKLGRCKICGQPQVIKHLCQFHREQVSARRKILYRLKKKAQDANKNQGE